MIDGATFLEGAVALTFGLLIVSLVLVFVRMAFGPSLADRVVALDVLGILLVAFAALLAVAFAHGAFLDVAITLALIGFLSTVAFARFAERRSADGGGDGDT